MEELPVFVFVHGGAFVIGSGADSYISPYEFNNNQVILVSLNYRLGVFGFPALSELVDEDPAAENLGLQDQRLAISWLIENIEHFGGNKDKISVFGESAGAMSLTWLLSSDETGIPSEDKILNKLQGIAIQSAPNIPYISCEEHYEMQRNVLSVLGCNEFIGDEYLSCLRNIDAQDFIEKLPGFGSFRKVFWHISVEQKYSFMPCVSAGNVFNKNPRDALDIKSDNDISIMIGTCKDEGSLFSWLTFLFHTELGFDTLEAMISYGFVDHDDDDDAMKIIRKYANPGTEEEKKQTSHVLSDIVNDVYFQCGNALFAESLTSSYSKVFRYVFNHLPSSGLQNLGVYHAAELPFVFGEATGGQLFPETFNEEDKQLAMQTNRYWSNFAKYGSPIAPNDTENEGLVNWPQHTSAEEATQLLGIPVESVRGYKKETCEFWNSLYPRGIPSFGEGDEMTKENWKAFIINESGFFLIRNRKTVFPVLIIAIFTLVISILYCCCCKGSKKSKQE